MNSSAEPLRRSKIVQFADALTMPLRALFMGPRSWLGLTAMRDERMWQFERFSKGKVLDIGCGPGNLFIRNFIGTERGIGIDFFAYDGVDTVIDDPTHLPFADETFDTVTLIAVGGHIPQNVRVAEFAEIARILKKGGRLLMSEGEPFTQWFTHKWQDFYYVTLLRQEHMDHERGMEHDEQFCMPAAEMLSYLNTPPLKHVETHRFQWGLNRIEVAERVS